MTPVEWGSLLGFLGTIIAAYLGYKQHKLSQTVEQRKIDGDREHTFIQGTMGRVDTLETRIDTLTDKVLQTAANAEEDRKRVITESEAKIESVRKEMRRLIDDAQFELATWRDRYFKLVDEYSKLRAEYQALEVKFRQLDEEYKELRGLYRRRATDGTEPTPE